MKNFQKIENICLPRVTACVTTGLVPSEALTSEVKARVTSGERKRVDTEARKRRKSGARISAADILREALNEYFETRRNQPNGKQSA